MAKRKALGTLAALGAAYKLMKPETVDLRGDSPEFMKDYAHFLRQEPRIPSDAVKAEMVREAARKRAGMPVITDEEQAEKFAEFEDIPKTESGIPIRTSDGFLTTQKKKGGKISVSRRGDGIAQRGKTRGKMV